MHRRTGPRPEARIYSAEAARLERSESKGFPARPNFRSISVGPVTSGRSESVIPMRGNLTERLFD